MLPKSLLSISILIAILLGFKSPSFGGVGEAAHPELAQNSTDIQQFIYDNKWNSLDFIYYLGYFAAKGNMNQVDNLLNYWLPTSSELDDNYRIYYQWFVAMYNDPKYKPSSEEVLAYANKCPLKSGRVVYAARALYNGLTHKVNKFINNCEGVGIAARRAKINTPNETIDIAVYPNPSTGLVNITLPKTTFTEAKNWFVTITDIYGKIVINKQLTSTQNQLNIVGAKGLYFTTIINKATGKQIVNKIILQ